MCLIVRSFFSVFLVVTVFISNGQSKISNLDSIPNFLHSDAPLNLKNNQFHLSTATKRATASAVLPGLGQALNKTYWKIPLFYMVWGILIGTAKSNHDQYVEARNALFYQNDHDPNTNPGDVNPSLTNATQTGLESLRDRRRRDREYYTILSVIWYFVGIADAAVTAHLSVEVNEQVRIAPKINYATIGQTKELVGGVNINIKLKK